VDSQAEVKPVRLEDLTIEENRIPETTEVVFTTTIDGILYRANSREQLLAAISHVHPVIADMEAPDQRFYNIAFHPKKFISAT